MAVDKGTQMEKVLLIDFENVQSLNLEQIEKFDYRIGEERKRRLEN